MKRLLFYFVLFTNTFIFAQGYKFLGSYTADGTPLYFAPSDVVSEETINLVKNSLPENFPVPDYNPHYISSDFSRDILLYEEAADVWVTFVSEGAGYRNVLGFYTYDLSTGIWEAPKASDITIIFPNVSGVGSGGSLVAGNKVHLGRFPAGTGIGWVLLANGWNGKEVTNGLWRLFSDRSFNPETDYELQYHNVLLNDPENERIILGFEDIRRDYNSCDNDFNDAVFYVTANPYTAIDRVNLADVSTAAVVTSGNNGGLESTGDLAALIAKRNFKRIKTNAVANEKSKQKSFSSAAKTASTLGSLLPTTGMYGTETTYVSSPTDLIGITNAQEVYSVDYYENDKRVAAVLATVTTGGIYGHSKAICDRLNNSTLEDVRQITLNGYEIIMAKIKRENGNLEYALNFSIQNLGSENTLHSYWNIDQYPTGNYNNFQVWGSTMGQVCSITKYIISQYKSKGTLLQGNTTTKIPSIFVKKGYYKNGQLHLKIINKSKASSVNFRGNQKATELGTIVKNTQEIALTTAYEQDIVVETGGLFDIGFSIQENNATIYDALYLADGPWGLDYVKSEVSIANYEISNSQIAMANNEYAIERNAKVAGTVYGTMNLFRNILPGELALDATDFSTVGFTIQNSLPVEVVLVTENMGDWNDRLRIQLPGNATAQEISMALTDFKNSNGQTYKDQKIKGFVFSTTGNYVTFQPFAIEISNLKLANSRTLSIVQNATATAATKMYNYPNPCSGATTVVLPTTTETAIVKIVDLTGRILSDKTYTDVASSNEIAVGLENINRGIYILMVTTKENESFQTRLIVN
jgi:hypothetical protein